MKRRSLLGIVGEPHQTYWRGKSPRCRASTARWWTDGAPDARCVAVFDRKSGPCLWDIPEVHDLVTRKDYAGIIDVASVSVTVHGRVEHHGGTIRFPKGDPWGTFPLGTLAPCRGGAP